MSESTENNDKITDGNGNNVSHIPNVNSSESVKKTQSEKMTKLEMVFRQYGNSLTLGTITTMYYWDSQTKVKYAMKRNSAMSAWLLKLEKKGKIKICRHNPNTLTYSIALSF